MAELGSLLGPDLQELIREKRWEVLRDVLADFDPSDVAEVLVQVPDEDDAAIFRVLPRDRAGQVFAYLPRDHQEALLHSLTGEQTRAVLRGMTPDDQARLLDELPAEVTRRILDALTPEELRTARDLLGYPPDTAGRFMTPQYVALRPDMTAAEALDFIRRHGRGKETLSIVYVVGGDGRLLDEIRLGALVLADPDTQVGEIKDRPLVSLPAATDVEEVLRAFKKYDRVALPVTDALGHMLGIITVDDVLDVAEREATEDIQKAGGMEALDGPYLETPLRHMLKKRGGWLSVLFLGEMLTATAMAYFDDELKKAVILAMFLPLIISSGGNSGSQAATLVVRALALAEFRLGAMAARLLARGADRHHAGRVARADRLPPHRPLAAPGDLRLRPPLPVRRPDHLDQPRRGRPVRLARGQHAAVRPPPGRLRPGDQLGAVRGHARRRDRADHLLLHRGLDIERGHAVTRQPRCFRAGRVREGKRKPSLTRPARTITTRQGRSTSCDGFADCDACPPGVC